MLTSKHERLQLDTFAFLVKQKVYNTIPLFSENLRAMYFFFSAGNKWYQVNYHISTEIYSVQTHQIKIVSH